MIFWDASALARCYARDEPGSARALHWLTHEEHHHGSALLVPEAISGVVRRSGRDRRLAEKIVGLLEEHLDAFTLVDIASRELEHAVRLIRKHALTAADAIHVATAVLHARDLGVRSMRFATCDGAQAAAARAEGLKVLEPA